MKGLGKWFSERIPAIRKSVKFILTVYFINIFFATWGSGYKLNNFLFNMTSHGGRDDIIAMFLLIGILGLTGKGFSHLVVPVESANPKNGGYLSIAGIVGISLAAILAYINVLFPMRSNIILVSSEQIVRQVATHCINGIIVFAVATILSDSFWVGLLTGLLFVVHPIHPEAILHTDAAYGGIVYAPLFLMSLLLYLLSQKMGKLLFYVASIILFISSLFFGWIAVSLPLIIIIADWQLHNLRGEEYSFKKRAKGYIPFLTILIVYLLLGNGISDYESIIFEEILKRILFVPFTTLILPLNRVVLKEWSLARGIAVLVVLIPFALSALNNRIVKNKTFLFGLLLVVCLNLPVCYKVYQDNAMGSSMLFYLSSIGFCLAIAYLIVNLDYTFGNISKEKIRVLLAALIILGYIFTTSNNNHRWLKASEVVKLESPNKRGI